MKPQQKALPACFKDPERDSLDPNTCRLHTLLSVGENVRCTLGPLGFWCPKQVLDVHKTKTNSRGLSGDLPRITHSPKANSPICRFQALTVVSQASWTAGLRSQKNGESEGSAQGCTPHQRRRVEASRGRTVPPRGGREVVRDTLGGFVIPTYTHQE